MILGAYKGEALLDVIMCFAVSGITSENGSEGFEVEYRKDYPPQR